MIRINELLSEKSQSETNFDALRESLGLRFYAYRVLLLHWGKLPMDECKALLPNVVQLDTGLHLEIKRRLIPDFRPWQTYLNVMPPAGSYVSFPGMNPEQIADAKLRAKYIAAIDANAIRADENALQDSLRIWMESVRAPRIRLQEIAESASVTVSIWRYPKTMTR